MDDQEFMLLTRLESPDVALDDAGAVYKRSGALFPSYKPTGEHVSVDTLHGAINRGWLSEVDYGLTEAGRRALLAERECRAEQYLKARGVVLENNVTSIFLVGPNWLNAKDVDALILLLQRARRGMAE